jgi:hypothetical protein
MIEVLVIPNETPFELLHTTVPDVAVCVPAAALIAGCTVCEKLAVIRDEPLIPKLMLFELLKTSVPVETDCVPADTPNGVSGKVEIDAVTVLPLTPNETEFEFENTIVPELASVVPAEIAAGAVDCE